MSDRYIPAEMIELRAENARLWALLEGAGNSAAAIRIEDPELHCRTPKEVADWKAFKAIRDALAERESDDA